MFSEKTFHSGITSINRKSRLFLYVVTLAVSWPLSLSAQDKWAFLYQDDTYQSNALMDLRSLNEGVAGEGGLVKLSPDGSGFMTGNDKPIRWWGVQSDIYKVKDASGKPDAAAMEKQCKWLAKRGVNMVRIHATIPLATEGGKITDVNDEVIEGIQQFVAIAKKEGIYSMISPLWRVDKIPESWGIEGATGKSSLGVLMVDPKFREGYKAWIKELYARPSKYGPPLKDDASIAIVQIQHEDSLLFWTLQGIPPAQAKTLGKAFGDWAGKKYGSLDAATKKWGAAWPGANDDMAAGILALYPVFNFVGPDWGQDFLRKAAQVEFITEFQRDYFKELADAYRALGAKQLINSTNWRPAEVMRLGDAERYSYGNQIMAVNRHTGGLHEGPNRSRHIDPGDTYAPQSDLLKPELMPFTVKQVVGQPFVITEGSWTSPERYQAEGPFLMSAYTAMNGVAGFNWFIMGNGGASGTTYVQDMQYSAINSEDQKGIWKSQSNTPQCVGQFPAYALAYRLSYVQAASEPAVYEERSLASIWQRDMPIIAEEGGVNPNRDQADFAADSPIKSDVDRRAFLVGPVKVKYGGNPANSKVVDLSKYVDEDKGSIKSITGEIELNHKAGLCTVKTQKWQGVAGFLKNAGGKFELPTVTIESDADYATISAVSLDNQPLMSSHKVLIQLGSVVRPTGWQESPATVGKANLPGFRIDNTGVSPFQVEKVRGKVTIKNASLKSADILDANFYSLKKVDLKRVGDGVEVELGVDALYIVLQ